MVGPREIDDPEKDPKATDPSSFVTEYWVEKVFKTVDTPLRTHRITLSYSKFAICLDTRLYRARRVGAGISEEEAEDEETTTVSNANWFNFATWGTYTLGPNIRNDGSPQRLDTLPDAIRRRVAPAIIQSRSAHGDVVGRALAWGQELIFLSASKALLRFVAMDDRALETVFRTPEKDRAKVLKAVNWSGHFIDEGHLTLVDRAFDCYRLVRRRGSSTAGRAQGSGRDGRDGRDPVGPLCRQAHVLRHLPTDGG